MRIVAGCDIDTAACLSAHYLKCNNRRRCWPFCKKGFDAIACQDFNYFNSKPVAQKAGVISDHHPLFVFTTCLKIICDGLGYNPYAFKGKIFCNDTTPARCAKFYGVHVASLHCKISSQPSALSLLLNADS